MKIYLKLAAFFGFSGVSLGAFGAHALKQILHDRGMTQAWETAVLYTLVHSVALLSVGIISEKTDNAPNPWLKRACACWALGILLFAGSLFGLALGGPRLLGPVTPVGGLFLIAGWICLYRSAAGPTSPRID